MTPGLSPCYARANDDPTGVANTAVDLTEGTGLNAGIYSATDAQWHDAGLGSSLPGSHLIQVFQGAANTQSASDTDLNTFVDYTFDGTNEVTQVAALPLTSNGLANFATFFNNGGGPTTKTLEDVTEPRNIIINA